MRIDGMALDPSHMHGYSHLGRSHHSTLVADEVRETSGLQADLLEPSVTDEQDQGCSEPAIVDGQDGTVPETQEMQGVIRLLLQGHFKGIADLRLRLNFAEELAGIELPEPSAPTGNGRAYQKFSELYTGPQQDDSVETPDGAEPVDSVA